MPIVPSIPATPAIDYRIPEPDFVRPGRLSMAAACERVGRELFPGEWTGLEPGSEELGALPEDTAARRKMLRDHSPYFHWRQPSRYGDPEKVVTPLTPDEYEAHRAANDRWRGVLKALRLLLHTGPSTLACVQDARGRCHDIERDFWVTHWAVGAIHSGRIAERACGAAGLRSGLTGWILVADTISTKPAAERPTAPQYKRIATISSEYMLENFGDRPAPNSLVDKVAADRPDDMGGSAKLSKSDRASIVAEMWELLGPKIRPTIMSGLRKKGGRPTDEANRKLATMSFKSHWKK